MIDWKQKLTDRLGSAVARSVCTGQGWEYLSAADGCFRLVTRRPYEDWVRITINHYACRLRAGAEQIRKKGLPYPTEVEDWKTELTFAEREEKWAWDDACELIRLHEARPEPGPSCPEDRFVSAGLYVPRLLWVKMRGHGWATTATPAEVYSCNYLWSAPAFAECEAAQERRKKR